MGQKKNKEKESWANGLRLELDRQAELSPLGGRKTLEGGRTVIGHQRRCVRPMETVP